MLVDLFLSRIIRVLNYVLHINPTTLKPIESLLSESSFFIVLKDYNSLIYIRIDHKGFSRVENPTFTDSDCIITTNISAILYLLLNYNDSTSLHDIEVDIEGNSHILIELIAIFTHLDLDWEFEISRKIGPLFTELVKKISKRMDFYSKEVSEKIYKNIHIYIEESSLLAKPGDISVLSNQVNILRMKADQLEVRMTKVEQI